MGRLLFVLLLVLAVVLWWKLRQRGTPKPPPAPPAPREAGPEAMLRCAECGVHLPSSQALPGKGGVFCSGAHRERFEARG